MIHITSQAAQQIREMLAEQKIPSEDGGLRIAVEGGGCSGMQYILSFDRFHQGDRVFVENEARIIIDAASLEFVDESTIDFSDGLNARGFRIQNPKAKQTCGCGTSFEA